MATSLAMDQPSLASQDMSPDTQDVDPFLSSSTSSNRQRFSPFDAQLFALGQDASPDQAKHALESHLAETERRIQEASKLGTALVQQRKELADRLKDVEKQQSDAEISPELQQKLSDIEREYNEVGRESARAFLPKSRLSSSEMAGSPFAGDKRSLSPTKFESQGAVSPSKLSVPSRKQRNQPANRKHDTEFFTEISTSLLSQVRHLQALLAEKEESLKAVKLENSRLEIEVEGISHRLRSLDESEHRYKDENWNLETQIHEYMAAAKESAIREKKLTHSLNVMQAEKTSAQKELDEIKLSHAKLSEDHQAAVKHHDVEFGSAKRSLVQAEEQYRNLQRKVEELTGQNTELAKAVAHQRGRLENPDQGRGLTDDDFDTAQGDITPEHSPPPSPIKGTPRHSMLETETLKSSLHHAHRMIQSLKANNHREKTEKLEVKRMLQDARDEIDALKAGGGMNSANGKRSRKVESREFKKPARPGQLGGFRNSRNEIIIDDTNWEEDNGDHSPSRSGAINAARVAMGISTIPTLSPDSSDHFDTANETSDAFETANERGTETEDFQTGVEDMGSSDDLTEREDGPAGVFSSKPTRLSLTKVQNRQSFQSTASTSGEEDNYDEVKTPTAAQPQRLKLKVNRGGNRRSRQPSEEPSYRSSPAASFANSSNNGTPQAAGQSLFAELGDMSDEEDSITGTPSRSGFTSTAGTPVASRPSTAKNTPAAPFAIPPVPKLPMVDSSTMTDSWQPEPSPEISTIPIIGGDLGDAMAGAAAGALLGSLHDKHSSTSTQIGPDMTESASQWHDKHSSTGTQVGPEMTDSASQWHEEQYGNHLTVDSLQSSRPISMSTYSDSSSQYDPTLMDERLGQFPSPPLSRAQTPLINLSALTSSPAPLTPAPLTMSTIYSEHVEPTETEVSPLSSESPESYVQETIVPIKESPPPLVFSHIQSVATEPIESMSPRTPKRDAMIIPRDESDEVFSAVQEDPFVDVKRPSPEPIETETVAKSEDPATPKAGFLGSVFGWKTAKNPSTPIIAEDETRQSPDGTPVTATPDSQKPFRELSNNTNNREAKMAPVETTDESCQTVVTSDQIEEMLNVKHRQATILIEDGPRLPSSPVKYVLKGKKSQESIASVSTPVAVGLHKRQTSAASSRHGSISSTHPPLPPDSKQVIAEAAKRVGSSGGPTPAIVAQRSGSISGTPATVVAPRSGSSSGAVGSMGPPLFPASAYKNGTYRPRTPSAGPKSPSLRDGTTPRVLHSSGGNGMQSPSLTGRSRRSSVSSFASELDNRFNIRGMVSMPQGLDSNTDPRMINAITQTMIGEYLWKYTRKAGRGAMSENRHRRYFWVHPYTRTLYWSDHDPSSAGRAELRAKSVPIEAVRVVTDDNPMPPGLHRKSLIIMTPGRAVKFTATTGQRHETWFNALSYLLLRTGEDAVEDTKELANGTLTREDVDEFNPGFRNSSSRRGPGSLSSYNSRTTHDTSPNRKVSSRFSNHPNNNSTSSRASMGTFSRLSNYWHPVKSGGVTGSSRSRHGMNGQGGSIYEASEVHDSAEDLREMIEKQDRESDKLENVRACCDGKHDVGHLHSHKKSSGQANTFGTASASRATAGSRAKGRSSAMRRTE